MNIIHFAKDSFLLTKNEYDANAVQITIDSVFDVIDLPIAKGVYWSGVKAVSQAVSLADSASQEHIFQRLLDDTKSNGSGDFYTLYDLIGNKITQSIFIRICFERDRLDSRNLRKWALQDLMEQPWDYTVPYSAAWFYRGVYDRISTDVKPDDYFWLVGPFLKSSYMAWESMTRRTAQGGSTEKPA